MHCGAINRDTNGTNGFDNTALFTVVSDDDVFPETDCQLRAPDYLGIVAVRLNISHNDGLCLHPVLANINQHHHHHHHRLTVQSSVGAISLSGIVCPDILESKITKSALFWGQVFP